MDDRAELSEDDERQETPQEDSADDNDGLRDPNSEINQVARSKYAESGVITKIKLVNFMCHENLEVNLSPHVNFIHGENGSGKSAILVAISTCLGVKASDTNRGASLKDLVRVGQDWAQIDLTLKNEGPDAFEPKKHSACAMKFGKSITIRREISMSGSRNGYKILNHNGDVMGKTKKDLQDILDHFNIQVENPCVVMNQDTTKEFLLSNKNNSKYEFFLRATQLQQMGDVIGQIVKDEEKASFHLEEAKKQLELIEEDFLEKENIYENTKNLATIEQQIDALRIEALWSKVRDYSSDLVDQTSKSAEYSAKLVENQERLDELNSEKLQALAVHNASKEKLQVEQSALQNDTNNRNLLQGELQTARKAIMRYQTQLQEHRRNESNGQNRKADLQKQLVQLEAERNRDRAEEDAARFEQLKQLQLRQSNEENEVDQIKSRMGNVMSEASTNREMCQKHKDSVSSTQQRLDDAKRRENGFRDAASNRLAQFGNRMLDICNEVQRQSNRFRVPPLGPVGSYVTLLDKQHASGVQFAIGKRLLGGFIVDSFDDMKVLSGIFNKVLGGRQQSPYIIVLQKSSSKYNIPFNSHLDRLTRVMDAISIDDPWCFNALIDKAKIENTVLMKRADEARDLLRRISGSKVMTPLVVLPNGDRILIKHGALDNQSGPGGSSTSILESITQDQIDDVAREIQHINNELKQLNVTHTSLQKLLSDSENAVRTLRRDMQAMNAKLEITKSEITSIERQNSYNENHTDDFVREIMEKIEKCDQIILDAQNDQANAFDNLKKAEDTQQEKLNAVQEFNELASTAGKNLELLTEEVSLALQRVSEVQLQIDEISRRNIGILRQHGIEESKRVALSKDLNALRSQALAESGNKIVETSRDFRDIKKEIDKLEAKMAADTASLNHGSLEEITDAYLKARERFTSAQYQIEQGARDLKKITRKKNSRIVDWETFKKRISKQASFDFAFNMSQKGHEGYIKFDHKAGTLNMFVKMANNLCEADMTTDTKALSGGERSFTTLAFVVAIGESIRTPFRALDEFDIFMDNVNRRIAIDLLQELARKYRNRQFILITPQDVSMVKPTATTFVLMLKPPARPAEA
uniref:RecF/RecN/SMC N-terminal domain-containing protein n=1 Tax=Spongospora subterranea TaxID=70186 RepID=A0A0H5R508_9EUKA|eukprot:CRZ09233.1 hypothetical protein [Spongospora subterranea]